MTDRTTPGGIPGLAELRLLRRELDGIGNPEATLALLVLLTMQAPGDVVLMDWRDVNLPSGTWLLPGRPHRMALLSCAAIATLITRARNGVRREGLVMHDHSGRPLGDPGSGARPLVDLLPAVLAPWTVDAIHEVAWAEWRRVVGVDLPPLATVGFGKDGAERIRQRHLERFALDEWARLLR